MSYASAATLPWEAGYVTPERAALEVANTPSLQEAAASAVASAAAAAAQDDPHDWTPEQARRQADEEGLALLLEPKNTTGYLWVSLTKGARPYKVQYPLRRHGKLVQKHGGCFASAEAAALSVAKMPEAREEALRRAVAA